MKRMILPIIVCAVSCISLQTNGMSRLPGVKENQDNSKLEVNESFFTQKNIGNYGEPIIKCGKVIADGTQYVYEKKPEAFHGVLAALILAGYYWWMISIFATQNATLQS